ncbi:MAG: hypothetical protein WBW38_11660 [Candidatus Sulfotelmatobacter sp.]
MALPNWLPEQFQEEGKRCLHFAEYIRRKCELEPNDLDGILKCVAANQDEVGRFLLDAAKSKDARVWEKACRVLTDGVSALRPTNTGPVNSPVPLR